MKARDARKMMTTLVDGRKAVEENGIYSTMRGLGIHSFLLTEGMKCEQSDCRASKSELSLLLLIHLVGRHYDPPHTL